MSDAPKVFDSAAAMARVEERAQHYRHERDAYKTYCLSLERDLAHAWALLAEQFGRGNAW